MEWDLFLGFKHKLFHSEADYDVGFLYYYYPGGSAPVPAETSYNFLEYYMGITYKGFEIKLSLTLTDYSGINSDNPPMNWNTGRTLPPNGHSFGSPYFEINYEWAFRKKWKATFHVAYQGVTNYHQVITSIG
jgi:uncharacterized protein (TIGR02001 family)